MVFNNYSLDYPFPFGSGVINAHLLPSSQRRSHDFARAVDDSRGRAQSKTDWALFTLDYNSSTGLIRGYSACRVQFVLVVCVVVAGSVVVSVVVVLVCANATGATNAQARAITVLFICTSLVLF